MITQPVTFVIGAGASKELGLPLGTELRDNIANDLREFWTPFRHLNDVSPAFEGIQKLANYLRPLTEQHSPNALLEASEKLIDGLPAFGSIDDFLSVYRDDVVVLALTKAMINLHIRETSQFALRDSYHRDLAWISVFWRIAAAGANDISELHLALAKIKIVNFNYDLTLEAGILKLVKQRFNVTQSEAISRVNKLQILHPYGSLFGSSISTWQETEKIYSPIQPNESKTASQFIRTIHEEPNSIGTETFQDFFKDARKIIFLGFGFHTSNLEWMDFEKNSIDNRHLSEVLFSHYGLSSYNAEQIKDKIRTRFYRTLNGGSRSILGNRIEARPETASEFLENISFGLN